MQLPDVDVSLLVRTHFSNDEAWATLCNAIETPSDEGFLADFHYVNDASFAGFTIEQLMAMSPGVTGHGFICIADQVTLTTTERPVLVVDLYEEPGTNFRVIPSEIWGVENNLSISNMDFGDFANNCDADGVFRGFA